MSALGRIRRLLPGLVVLGGAAILARTIGNQVQVLSPLIVAIAVGVLVANTVGIPEWASPGVDRHSLILETGIVLLAARLTVEELVSVGPIVVGLASAAVVFGLVFSEAVAGRLLGVGQPTKSLLAAGASVCGVSAVLAVAGSIDVDETDIAYAVATILLFDAVTLVVYPVLGGLVGLTAKQFGVWAGLSLFSTGPTAAVGFSVSQTAGEWATITKLVRNSFIGVLAVAYAVVHATAVDAADVSVVWNRFPKFLFGFVVVAAIANTLSLSPTTADAIGVTGDWLFTLAFAGLGFDMELRRLKATGSRPVAMVVVHLLTIGAVSLALVLLFL
jgi:uncharacterized integral membrane protein (TIGR00698 family)